MLPMQAITTQISEAMDAQEMSTNRLAILSGVPRVTLERRMKNPSTFTISEIGAVASALGLAPVIGMTSAARKASA